MDFRCPLIILSFLLSHIDLIFLSTVVKSLHLFYVQAERDQALAREREAVARADAEREEAVAREKEFISKAEGYLNAAAKQERINIARIKVERDAIARYILRLSLCQAVSRGIFY